MLALSIHFDDDAPRYLQLYRSLREAIVSGMLKPGQRVLASRRLAQQLGIARGTVLQAYEQLDIEGYFVSRVGAGTFVADIIPEAMNPAETGRTFGGRPALLPRGLSERLRRQFEGPDRYTMRSSIFRPFQPGLAPIDVFPRATLARFANAVYRSIPAEELGFGDGAGYGPLREALASYLRTTRGLVCTPEQVIVTTGSQQGFQLAAHAMLDAGDALWMEDPGYGGARVSFRQAGLRVASIPLDDEGLSVRMGRSIAPRARMAYVTPAHQYPTGVTMSLERRLELIRWAAENEAWILEDDYDGEFRYQGLPLATLQGLDPHKRVIYVGSLSKVLAPALRVGYLIVPEDLIEPFRFAKAATDRHTPTILQAVIARFIEEGHFGRHVRRVRILCRERQAALLDAAHTYLKDRVFLTPDPAGLHLVGRLADGLDDRRVSEEASRHSLVVPAISNYCVEHFVPDALILGYGCFTPAEMHAAMRRLAAVIS